jgi:hypothetical protein
MPLAGASEAGQEMYGTQESSAFGAVCGIRAGNAA